MSSEVTDVITNLRQAYWELMRSNKQSSELTDKIDEIAVKFVLNKGHLIYIQPSSVVPAGTDNSINFATSSDETNQKIKQILTDKLVVYEDGKCSFPDGWGGNFILRSFDSKDELKKKLADDEALHEKYKEPGNDVCLLL